MYHLLQEHRCPLFLSPNLTNVVNRFLQCYAATCQQLLSTIIVHGCSGSTIIVQSLLTTNNKLVSSMIVGSRSNNIVTTIALSQHRTTIDRTILIKIGHSTSVAEPDNIVQVLFSEQRCIYQFSRRPLRHPTHHNPISNRNSFLQTLF